jgi:lincosamide and streptogramin A transport system ATP-binding/permease protein
MMKRSKVIESRIEKEIDEKKSLLKNVDRQDSLTMKPLVNKRNPIIILDNVSVIYNQKQVFEPVSFEIRNNDRIALIGKNGAGKSSIVKLILNDEKMDYNGNIRKPEQLKISYVSQNTDFLKGTLKNYAKEENIDESIFKAMLAKMGFDIVDLNKNIEDMSEGQKKKVLLAKSISESADVYLWDEPLNYIDIITREQIEEAILKYMPTLVFVEHDDTFVKKIATKKVEVIRKDEK